MFTTDHWPSIHKKKKNNNNNYPSLGPISYTFPLSLHHVSALQLIALQFLLAFWVSVDLNTTNTHSLTGSTSWKLKLGPHHPKAAFTPREFCRVKSFWLINFDTPLLTLTASAWDKSLLSSHLTHSFINLTCSQLCSKFLSLKQQWHHDPNGWGYWNHK